MNDHGARISIDLNADLGEGFGSYQAGPDEELLALVSSANLACGFHAGDPLVMRAAVARAAGMGVAIGAHPGYRDLAGFGRRFIDADPEEIYTDTLYQIGALAAFCRVANVPLRHVKGHGALYTRATKDQLTARALMRAVRDFDPGLLVFAPAGTALQEQAEAHGLRVVAELFADRAINPDGSLVSRRLPGAMIDDPDQAAARAVRMARDHRAT
ncbi:MAG: LamB/YcsF family protein, partial [Chloroflexota bacterium]